MAKKQAPQRAWQKVPVFIRVLLVLVGASAVYRFGVQPAGDGHPKPRSEVTATAVVDATRYAAAPDIQEVYAQAKQIPEVLDGLHCYCECARHAGHRSLLTCFESDHGAACDVCLGEAALAYQLTQEGQKLEQIRAAIDAEFGRG